MSLIVPHCDTEVFQVFLDTMAAEVPEREGKRVLLVLDNAKWHKTKRLTWHHIVPVFLPPYSPDLNPIERFWQHLVGFGILCALIIAAAVNSNTDCRSESSGRTNRLLAKTVSIGEFDSANIVTHEELPEVRLIPFAACGFWQIVEFLTKLPNSGVSPTRIIW